MTQDPTPQLWFGINVASGSALLAALFSWLPTAIGMVGGVLLIVRLFIEIKESVTYRTFMADRRERIRVRKLRKLRARQKIIEAKIIAADRVKKAVVEAAQIVESAKTDAALTKVQDKAIDQFTKD
jgi:hypothetical protein